MARSPATFIFFDLGGVLLTVQRPEEYSAAMTEVAKELKVESAAKAKALFYDSEEWDGAKVGKMSSEALFSSVCAAHGVTDADQVSKISRAVRIVGKGIDQRMKRILAELAELRKLDAVRIGILSNYDTSLDEILQTFPELATFDFVVNSAVIGEAKPSRRAYELAMDIVGIKENERIVFIDDKPRNTDVAAQIGWQALVFKNKDDDYRELRKVLGLSAGDV